MVIQLEDSPRTQLVVIRSSTFQVGGTELREVWSAAYECAGEVPPQVARGLLEDNLSLKVGCWATLPQAGHRQLVLFVARMPADASLDALEDYLEDVAELADAMEEDLSPPNAPDKF